VQFGKCAILQYSATPLARIEDDDEDENEAPGQGARIRLE